jgi:hypothetical protein
MQNNRKIDLGANLRRSLLFKLVSVHQGTSPTRSGPFLAASDFPVQMRLLIFLPSQLRGLAFGRRSLK